MANPLHNAFQGVEAPGFFTRFGEAAGRTGNVGSALISAAFTGGRNEAFSEYQQGFFEALNQGLPPAQAFLKPLERNPNLLSQIDVNDINKLVTIAAQGADAGTTQMQNLAELERRNPGLQLPVDVQAQALGVVPETPDKLRIAAGIEAFLGRKPTEAEYQRFFSLVSDPSTVVNVGAPDLGPVFSFLEKGQAAERQDLISQINTAMPGLNELEALTNLPEAQQLFGPIGSAAALAAPFAEIIGSTRAFGIYGPDVKTLGEARSRASKTLADVATIIFQNGRDLSNQKIRVVSDIMNNPNSWFTSATQVRTATKLLKDELQRIQGATAGELSQGGVAPEGGTVSISPGNKTRILERAKAILNAKGIDPETGDDAARKAALDQAKREIVGTSQ